MWRLPYLASFFPEFQLKKMSRFFVWQIDQRECVVMGWGLRPSTKRARAFAHRNAIPYIAIEDGFLRSVGLGVAGFPPLSLVYDDLGIYYDTTKPSRLEKLILSIENTPSLLEEGNKAIGLIRQYRLSKYNHAPDFVVNGSQDSNKILVVDQTYGDMAVTFGQADEKAFHQMLQTAINENQDAEIWVKVHPDVLAGKKRGYLTHLISNEKIHLISEDVNVLSLLESVHKVYCVTSQMGFEALLLGKKVVTFGVPWYAGWGLTDDRHYAVQELVRHGRRESRTLLQLFCASYLQYSRYIDPKTGQAGTLFDVIHYIHKMKQLNQRLCGDLYCVGVSLWKQAILKPFFNLPSCRLHFVKSQKKLLNRPLVSGTKLLIWGQGSENLLEFAQNHQLPVLRMEDGFIRSVGLGSNLVPPLSLVVDDLGIYFNPEIPSRLEKILETTIFSPSDLEQALELREKLIVSNIGKYNVGVTRDEFPNVNKKRILVPGQVEDDASIQFGSPHIKSNLALLKVVRDENPDAYIIYKPHPDVVSGNRKGYIERESGLAYADLIVEKENILDCIMWADEVHTMTSLAGFEALLRDKSVHCYGIPFYSNWGLTVDRCSLSRRNRKLSLAELIAGVLLYYPIYVNPNSAHFIDANRAISLLVLERQFSSNDGFHRLWILKQLSKLKQLYQTLIRS